MFVCAQRNCAISSILRCLHFVRILVPLHPLRNWDFHGLRSPVSTGDLCICPQYCGADRLICIMKFTATSSATTMRFVLISFVLCFFFSVWVNPARLLMCYKLVLRIYLTSSYWSPIRAETFVASINILFYNLSFQGRVVLLNRKQLWEYFCSFATASRPVLGSTQSAIQ